MNVFKAIAVAFGMYSKIPFPQVEWDDKSLRYALCAFPLIGLVQGVLCLLWGLLNQVILIPEAIMALGFVLLPLFVNGGIHLDGLSDTTDALASYAPREKRLEILKDSHIGAFGVLALMLYLLSDFAFFTAFVPRLENLLALMMIFALSRTLSGWVVITWPSARKQGTAQTFQEGSAGRKAQIILVIQAVLYLAGLIVFSGFVGVAVIGAAFIVLVAYRVMAMKDFGGVTGDLAGWFLQISELAMIVVLVLGGLIA